MILVDKKSAEWAEVEGLFLKTSPGYRMHKLERVQMIGAWTRFQAFKQTNKHTKENEMLLFH
jgi:hypothetical protein